MEVDKQTLKQQIKAAVVQDANALPMFRKLMSQTKYKTKQLLGRGECSTTWLVESGSGKIHVLKKVDMSRREEAMKEVNILASCSHRNIVRFGGAFVVQKEKCLLIITEFADSGNLEDYIERRRRNYNNFLNEFTVRKYFVQISLGLQYLHKKNIALDLKSKNIYLTKQHLLRIGGFSKAKVMEGETEDRKKEHDKTIDIKSRNMFSLGKVLYELCALEKLKENFQPIPEKFSPYITSSVADLLFSSDDRRPTIDILLDCR